MASPIYFWKPSEDPYGVFSQWYGSPFVVDGVTYQSAEMWMMIQKARLFGDHDCARKMAQTKDPKRHKALGRQAKGFDETKWDENKSRIVEEGNFHKFTKSSNKAEMLKVLMSTGNRELVEASPYDSIWGIGYTQFDADENRATWGENLLGKAIMKVRDQLREQKRQEAADPA